MGVKGKLPGKRVTEIAQIFYKGVVPKDPFERLNQRRVKKSRNPSVKLVGQSRIITLAELEVQTGMDDRINQPCNNCPFIVYDVAVVQGDRVNITASKNIAGRH